jgi:hypothetical protein
MALTINGTTGIALPDGSVASPSNRGQDANSGVSYGADSIKFSTGGVERMSISNSGVAGGGKILQVVEARLTSDFSHTSTSNTDVGLSVSITPSSTSSKILVSFTGYTYAGAGSDHNPYGSWAILRGSTIIMAAQQGWYMNDTPNKTNYGNTHMQILDTPSTTSATTYKIQARTSNSNVTQNLNVLADPTWAGAGFNAQGTLIIAMEVGA